MIKLNFQKLSLDVFFKRHGNWYIALFLLFSFIRIVWTIDRGLQHNLHDPYLYLECAKHIACGDWLGPLDVVTISKSCIYPVFISLSLITGIPYLLMVDLCWFLAALLAVRALSPIMKQPARILLYIAVIFQPLHYDRQILTIQELYLLLIFCTFIGFAGLWIRYNRDKGFSFPWLAGSGLFFSLTIHTRDEGIAWILLPLTYGLLIVIRSIRKDKLSAGKLIRRLLYAALVIFIAYEAIDQPIRIANYRHYNFYGCNIRHSHAWKQFVGTLIGIAKDLDPRWDIRVAVRYDMLDQIYELSPNFAKLKRYLRRDNFFAFYPAERFPKEELERCPDLKNNIKGGFLHWELLAAVKTIGLMKNNDWHDMENYFYAVVDDFRKAAEAGKIRNLKVRTSSYPPVCRQMFDWYFRKTGWTVERVFWDPQMILRSIHIYVPDSPRNAQEGLPEGNQPYENELYRCLKSDNYFMHDYYLVFGWGFQPKAGATPLKREFFGPAGNVLSIQVHPRPDVKGAYRKSFPGVTDQVGFRMTLTSPLLEVRDDSGRVVYKGDISKQRHGNFVHFDIVRKLKELPQPKQKRTWIVAHCKWIARNIKWMFLASIVMAVFLLVKTFRTGFYSPYSKLLISGTSLWCGGTAIFFIIIFANVLLHCPRQSNYLFPAVLMHYFSYCTLLIGGISLLVRGITAFRLKKRRRRKTSQTV